MAKITLNQGVPMRARTTKEIRRQANVAQDHFLVSEDEEGQYQILSENQNLPEKKALKVVAVPRFEQGMLQQRKYNYGGHVNLLHRRILDEARQISFDSPVQLDDQNMNYICLEEVRLNADYSQSRTRLLIRIPRGYPQTPPHHFYLVSHLLYKGRQMSHYFDNDSFNEMKPKGWGKYCLHPNAWRPSARIEEGDNLYTYAVLCKTVLDNPEQGRM